MFLPFLVSSGASPTGRHPNRDDPPILVGKAAVTERVEREAIATLRLKKGWHGPL